jgi:uncharacterized protein
MIPAAAMLPSRHNIVSRIRDSDRWFVVNLLSGEADLLDENEASALLAGDPSGHPEFLEKGYVVDPSEDQKRLQKAYADFLDGRESDEVQLFYVPGYVCNFACSYCYQDRYEAPSPGEQSAVIDAFFAYVDKTFAARSKYVTVFGGEPLLPSASARAAMERLVSGTRERGLDLAVVTNGFHLDDYVGLLGQARIREVQVTLDGVQDIHDKRRYLAGGQGTFLQIVAGVDACLAAGLPVNLRVVLDRENVASLPALAALAIEKGWTQNPKFKTQLGRNYELHHCQSDRGRIYSRLELYQDLYALIRQHPEILQFHRPAYSVARFLADEGKLPEPLFDSCPGCKTEWAFDYTGRIYPCTATVGKVGEEVGTFYPEVRLQADRVQPWEDRDVLAIEKCKTCPVALACGGGCASVSKNSTGDLHAPDCRPIQELLELGLGLYQR